MTRSRTSRTLGLILPAALATIAVAGTEWANPAALSPAGQDSAFPSLGVDSGGAATVIWMGTVTLSDLAFKIRAATRGAGGGAWTPAANALSEAGAFAPALAVGGDGSAVAAWYYHVTTVQKIQACVRSAGGAFGAAVDVTVPSEDVGGVVSVALDATGSGGVVFPYFDATSKKLGIRLVNSGALAAARATVSGGTTIYPVPFSTKPSILAATSGFYVALDKYSPPTILGPKLLGPPAGGAFAAPADISPTAVTIVSDPVIAAAAGGLVAAAWRASGGVYARVGSESAQLLTATADRLTLVGGPDGTLVAAWMTDRVYAAARPAGASAFGAAEALSETGDGFRGGPYVAFAGNRAVVVWSRSSGLFDRIEASELSAGGSFPDVAKTLSGKVGGDDGDATYPAIAGDASGHVTVVWTQSFKDDGSGSLYNRVVTTTSGFGPPDLKAPKVGAFKTSNERFAAGASLNDVVLAKGSTSVMFPEGKMPKTLKAGTQFLFSSTEGGTYQIVIRGLGCATFHQVGRKPREDRTTVGCSALADTVTLAGVATKKTNRITYFGAGLTPGGYYEAELTVSDAAGNDSKSRKVRFHFDGP